MRSLSFGSRAILAQSCLLAAVIGALACASRGDSSTDPPASTPGADAPATPAPPAGMQGPSASKIQPGEAPVDVRAIPLPEGVERAWLQKDADMIWRVRSHLPPATSVASFLRALDAEGAEETDLGYGVKRHQATIGAGYTSCNFAAASHAGALLSLRVECWSSADPATLAAILPILDRSLGDAFTRDERTARVTFAFPAAEAGARATLDRELGALAPIDAAALPPAEAGAYETLTSPRDALTVGTRCGEAGVVPAGREAVTVLETANRVDLLRNVLRGPSPGGRVYAAKALDELGAMRPEDAAVVKKLAALSIDIETCDGCIFSSVSSAEAFAASE